MREIARQVADRLSPVIRSCTAFDGVSFRQKGRDAIAVIHPEKLRWGERYPCAQGSCRSFSLTLRISLLIPMNGDAAEADRLFDEVIEPELCDLSLEPLGHDEPKTDLQTDRLQCSRRYLLTGVKMTETEETA